jgi:hypothetical protein
MMNIGMKTLILLVALMVGVALFGRFCDEWRARGQAEPDFGLCPFCGRGQ